MSETEQFAGRARPAWIARSALAASALLIVVATLSPQATSEATGAAGWTFSAGTLPITDACANVLLFVPLGAALVWCGWRAPRATIAGVLLSLLIELLQSRGFPSGRYPTVADVLSNGSGALVGALLASIRHQLLRPTPAIALRLVVAWTVGACALMAATGWALALPTAESQPERAPVLSALPNTPGYPWFPGFVRDVVVSGASIPHAGTGPVRVEAEGGARTGSLTMGPRHDYSRLLPLLYVHARGDTVPQFIVGQHGLNLELHSRRRGAGHGVRMPFLVLPQVLLDSNPVAVRFSITGSALRLAATHGARVDSAQLAVTPMLGWVMMQNEIGISTGALMTGTMLWIALLVGPAFYWGRWARRESTLAAPRGPGWAAAFSSLACWSGSAAAIGGTAVMASVGYGLAILPAWQWATAGVTGTLGAALARWVRARRDRPR